MPYGETWIDEVSNKNIIDYKFTGKELDTETGLYYFGARYLDPQLSRWISTDPALGDYMPEAPVDKEAKKRNRNLPGNGGVFNPVNLAVYHYSGNNPIKYKDPNGAFVVPFVMDNEALYSEQIVETNPEPIISDAELADKHTVFNPETGVFADFSYVDPGNVEGSQGVGERGEVGLVRIGKYSKSRRTRISLATLSGKASATAIPGTPAGEVSTRVSVFTLSGQYIAGGDDGDPALMFQGDLNILGVGAAEGTQRKGVTTGLVGGEVGWDLVDLEGGNN